METSGNDLSQGDGGGDSESAQYLLLLDFVLVLQAVNLDYRLSLTTTGAACNTLCPQHPVPSTPCALNPQALDPCVLNTLRPQHPAP